MRVVVENSVSLTSRVEDWGNTELQTAKFLRRKIAMGVLRTGAAPRAFSTPFSEAIDRDSGVSLAQTISPERHNASSHAGSYSIRRLGRSSPSHAAAGASKPSNCSIMA